MKKTIIIISIVLGIILLFLVLIPAFFKPTVVRIIEKKTEKHFNSKLEIGDISVSIIRDFPDLNVKIKDIVLYGSGKFKKDTLVDIPYMYISVNIKSLMSGNVVKVNKIESPKSKILPHVDAKGNNNWYGLTKKNESKEKSNDKQKGKSKDISIKKIEWNNILVKYNNEKDASFASTNVNLNLTADMSGDNTKIKGNILAKDIYYREKNTVWLNKHRINLTSTIDANMDSKIFKIENGKMAINNFDMILQGSANIDDKDNLNMDINISSTNSNINSILDLIPEALKKDLVIEKSNGKLYVNAAIKGFFAENEIPALDINMNIENGMLKFKNMPEPINDISLNISSNKPQGIIDNLNVDITKATFNIARNPFFMKLLVKNVKDPILDISVNGNLDFDKIKNAVPVKNMGLSGFINTELSIKGKYKFIEKEEYEKFTAKGHIDFNNIVVKNKTIPKGISLSKGRVNIYPDKLSLNRLYARSGSSDFQFNGSLYNYLQYFFKSKELKGDFKLKSHYLNLNEFKNVKQEGELNKEDNMSGIIIIPKNIKINVNADIDQMIADNITMTNISGKLYTENGIARLKNMKMDMLKGRMIINGLYDVSNVSKPAIDLSLNANNIDINSTYNSFSPIRKSLPMAIDCEGEISWNIKFSSILDKNMSPIMETSNGKGNIMSRDILIRDENKLMKMFSFLNHEELSRISISKLDLNFEINNGDIKIKPFTTKIAGNKLTMYGTQGVGGDIDYTMSVNLQRKYFGKQIDKLLSSIPGNKNIKDLDFDIKIGGTLEHPEPDINMSKAIDKVKKEAGNSFLKGILKGIL